MSFDTEIKDMLIRHEGLVCSPYKCSEGKLTIGVGRNLEANGISEDEAHYLLDNDIKRVKENLDRSFKMWRCMPKRARLVCIDMAYQMGISGFLGFRKTIALMQMDMWLEASEEILRSKYNEQTPNRCAYNSRQLALCHGEKIKRRSSS